MTIGYANEAQCCVRNADLEAGHWYLDEDRQLFIVPDNGEIEGPDDETLCALNTAYRRMAFAEIDRENLANELGLTVVHSWQQRFDSVAGYFAV